MSPITTDLGSKRAGSREFQKAAVELFCLKEKPGLTDQAVFYPLFKIATNDPVPAPAGIFGGLSKDGQKHKAYAAKVEELEKEFPEASTEQIAEHAETKYIALLPGYKEKYGFDEAKATQELKSKGLYDEADVGKNAAVGGDGHAVPHQSTTA